jgi:hypothetical protein
VEIYINIGPSVCCDISAGIAADYNLNGQCSIPGGDKISPFHLAYIPAPGLTQLAIEFVSGAIYQEVQLPGRETISFHLLPRVVTAELCLHFPTYLHGIVLN